MGFFWTVILVSASANGGPTTHRPECPSLAQTITLTRLILGLMCCGGSLCLERLLAAVTKKKKVRIAPNEMPAWFGVLCGRCARKCCWSRFGHKAKIVPSWAHLREPWVSDSKYEHQVLIVLSCCGRVVRTTTERICKSGRIELLFRYIEYDPVR